jgi:hypothetical protein
MAATHADLYAAVDIHSGLACWGQAIFPPRSSPCGREAGLKLRMADRQCRPSSSIATATPRCASEQRRPDCRAVRQGGRFEGKGDRRTTAAWARLHPHQPCRSGRACHLRALETPGREVVPPAPTPIRAGRTRRGRCCASSSSTRSRVSRGSQGARSSGTSPNFRISLASPTSPLIPVAADGGGYA